VAEATSLSRDPQTLPRMSAAAHRMVSDCTFLLRLAHTTAGGRPVVGAAASFSALLVLVLRFRGSLLGVFLGVLLGAQSLRVVLFLGFFLVDDLCEELLHLLGHAGG